MSQLTDDHLKDYVEERLSFMVRVMQALPHEMQHLQLKISDMNTQYVAEDRYAPLAKKQKRCYYSAEIDMMELIQKQLILVIQTGAIKDKRLAMSVVVLRASGLSYQKISHTIGHYGMKASRQTCYTIYHHVVEQLMGYYR